MNHKRNITLVIGIVLTQCLLSIMALQVLTPHHNAFMLWLVLSISLSLDKARSLRLANKEQTFTSTKHIFFTYKSGSHHFKDLPSFHLRHVIRSFTHTVIKPIQHTTPYIDTDLTYEAHNLREPMRALQFVKQLRYHNFRNHCATN